MSFEMKFSQDKIRIIPQIILHSIVCRKIPRRIFMIICGLLIIYYLIDDKRRSRSKKPTSSRSTIERDTNMEAMLNVSPNVYIVDLHATTRTKFHCIEAKKLLNNISTHICLHDVKKDRYISGAFHPLTSIWEEQQVIRILELLIRHPNLHFIDIGANIGTYTMYAAALGRFVLAIDCFAPNLVRLRRSIQLMNMTNQVILIQNALFTHSGQSMRLSIDTKNIGGQGIHISGNFSNKYRARTRSSTKNPYIVQTITFDEILPILTGRGIRAALMKIDIEGSEGFVIENGHHVFDTIYIPLVQMEWKIIKRHANHVNAIFDFFDKRHYYPITDECAVLKTQDYSSWPKEIYWLKKNVSNFC